MQSMTGYGQSEVHDAAVTLSVEVRAVNHRYLDISWRYPRVYTPLEARMKQLVSARVARGRLDIKILQQESIDTPRQVTLDHALARQYYAALQALQSALHLPGTIDVGMVMGLRDILTVEEATPEDIERAWPLIAQGLEAALEALTAMRRQEGAALGRDLQGRLQHMLQQVTIIRARVPHVVIDYRQRLEQRVKEWFQQFELDADRVAQEAILFAERTDITEELTRLEAHLHALHDLLSSSEAVGRKIDFLLQEMHREINTIGAKSNDVTIAHSVVDMKSELERCREQIQNIE